MLKAFNSLQITALFAAAPYGLYWLLNADFYAHIVAFWTALIVYFIFFCLMCGAVFHSIDEIN